MEVQFAKWGNSVALRVPSKVVESLGIVPGSVANLDLKRDFLCWSHTDTLRASKAE